MWHRDRGVVTSERREPDAEGEAFSFVHSDHFYVWQYSQPYIPIPRHSVRLNQGVPRDDGSVSQLKLPLQRYSFSSAQWNGVLPESVDPKPEEISYLPRPAEDRVCCAVLGDCAYTFGGFWYHGYAVHELNLETMIWRRLKAKHREGACPMNKKNAGMVACGGEALCVFGGFGPDTGRHQPGATYHTDDAHPGYCLTNELHLFDIKTGNKRYLEIHRAKRVRGIYGTKNQSPCI